MFRKTDIPKSIDFLKPVTRADDIWANAYEWMFQVGKYMLIVVEIVALSVFVSRFIIDEKNNDLTRDINNQVAILSGGSWQQNSITYENIQNLIGDIDRISENQKINSVIINEIRDGIPRGLNVKTFSFNNERISLNLQTSDFKAFKEYESAIKNNPNYENVTFSTTKNETVFDIRVSFAMSGGNG